MSEHFRVVLCDLNDMTSRDIQRCTNSDAHLEWGFRILFRLCDGILFFQDFLAVGSFAQAAETQF